MTVTKDQATAQNLVRDISSGDKVAEQRLVSQYWHNLFVILLHRSKNRALAEDLCQETFIVVLQKARASKIENPDSIGAFIRQVGINLLIAHYRKEQRRDTETNSEIEAEDLSPNLHRILHSQQAIEHVHQLIAELPTERDREILKHFYIYEHDKATICSYLDLTAEHFDRVLYRAKDRLKKILEHRNEIGTEEFLAFTLPLIAILGMQLPASTDLPTSQDFTGPTANLEVRESDNS